MVSDANPPIPVQPTTRWGMDPLQMKSGPITRAQVKRFKDNLAGFMKGVIKSQEGMTISEDLKPVLSIQVVETDMDLGS